MGGWRVDREGCEDLRAVGSGDEGRLGRGEGGGGGVIPRMARFKGGGRGRQEQKVMLRL